jgi:hypothetical protein
MTNTGSLLWVWQITWKAITLKSIAQKVFTVEMPQGDQQPNQERKIFLQMI